ncbi:hypothetical protein [Mucisphaera sp.]|uniref:hypothetical protein n=1 Tax=Mucisphaera sp. TaxID=2913024 RepID=UPI003D148A05
MIKQATQIPTPIDGGRHYARTLWIGTAPFEALTGILEKGLELVRLGGRGFWAIETGKAGPGLLLLTQAMTRDADVIRGMCPVAEASGLEEDVTDHLQSSLLGPERPAQTVFATATDLREWLSTPVWSRVLSIRDEHLIAKRSLPAPDYATGSWSHQPPELAERLSRSVAQGARLEACLTLEGISRTQEIIRKPLLGAAAETPSMAMFA